MGHRHTGWRLAAAGCLLFFLALVAATSAGAADPPAWTWAEVTAEWDAIRAAGPGLPGLGAGPAAGAVVLTRTPGQRGWTWCPGRPPCGVIVVGIPDTGWRESIWHEAGHVAMYAAGVTDLAGYRRARGVPAWWRGPAWLDWEAGEALAELWAEDWRACFGPADLGRHWFWLYPGSPGAGVCEWLAEQME